MMKPVIYCVKNNGIHSFFMFFGKEKYYLFCQNYRKGVQEYYSKGVSLNESINFSKSRNDSAIIRTMSKLPMYIRYIEKEFGIEVLEQTKKKSRYYNNGLNKCA